MLLLLSITLQPFIDKGQWEKVVMDYFLEDARAMLTLSDSENESDDEEIPDLGKNILIEEDISLLMTVMGKKRRSTVLLSQKKLTRVLKSVECLVEAKRLCKC